MGFDRSKRVVTSQEHAEALGGANLYNLFPPGSKWHYNGGERVLTVLYQSAYKGIGGMWYVKCVTPQGYQDGYPASTLTPAASEPDDLEQQRVALLEKQVQGLKSENQRLRDELVTHRSALRAIRSTVGRVRLSSDL